MSTCAFARLLEEAYADMNLMISQEAAKLHENIRLKRALEATEQVDPYAAGRAREERLLRQRAQLRAELDRPLPKAP